MGGKPIRFDELAKFVYYAPGKTAAGKDGLLKQDAEAWIVEDEHLRANCLLGSDWSNPRGIDISYSKSTITYPDCRNFSVPFRILKKASKPVVRKVTLARAITLKPGQTAHVAVSYVDLPKDRAFNFTSSHPTAMNAVLDAKVPKMMVLHNPGNKDIKVNRNVRLGTIHEAEDSAHFTASFGGVVKALAMASSIGQVSPVAEPQNHELTSGTHNVSWKLTEKTDITPMGGEFEMTPDVVALAQGKDIDTKLLAPVADSAMPFSDAVCAAISEAHPEMLPQEVAEAPPDHTRFERIEGSLNIKTPDKAPSLVTDNGIHIYNEKPNRALKLQRIAEARSELWKDKGPIDLPVDQMMKVPLIDGWQHAKLNCRRYPLSKKGEEVLDKVYGKLHDQGRMEYTKEICPFALPVFVVWRTVHGVEKGRAVVDLRPLNKWAVPDSYPLPLQSDLIEVLCGKGYISVIDASTFFYQFLVHPDYRDRFTIISHRGLERYKVAPMGYRNSPAHAQRFMDRLLELHRSYCRAFIDDMIIYSDTFEEHCQHLSTVFDLFLEKGLSISPEKSYLGYPSVELLGFYVDSLGLSTIKERTEGFQNLEFPAQLKALETYLGATGFLRTMVPYYAQLSEPLQKRKISLLAAGRASGRVQAGNKSKRLAYTSSTLFEPTSDEIASFDALQSYVCTKLRLYHMTPDKTLFLQVDGSLQRGFGVMVYHLKDGTVWAPGQSIPSTAIEPVMFLSRCLSKPENNYGPSELEVACLVWACKRLRTMLHSSQHPIVVLTDHDATRGIVEKTLLNTTSTDRSNRRLVNASIYLSEYNLQVHHLAGRLNLVPDALSRLTASGDAVAKQRSEEPVLDAIWDQADDHVMFLAEAQMDDTLRQRFADAYKHDKAWNRIINGLATPTSVGRKPSVVKDNEDIVSASKPGHAFRLVDHLLYNRDNNGRERLVIPRRLIQEILASAHDDKHHFGRDRMAAALDGVHMQKKRHKIETYVKKCHQCGAQRKDNQMPLGSLQPIQAPEEPMHTITMDFVVVLPSVSLKGTLWHLEGYDTFDALMPVTCKTSKRSLLIPGHTTYTAKDWATVLTRQLLLSDWSCPQAIISDRDAKFLSAFWQGLWKAFGIRLQMTTAYHPQADGQSERKNQDVELALRYYVAEHPDSDWVDVLPALQWNLNSAHSRTLDASPYEFLFGFKIPGPVDRLTSSDLPLQTADIRFMREHLRRDAQLAMDIVASDNKTRYDAQHRQIEFDVGSKVWLKMGKAYKPLFKTLNAKLMAPREGPYTVTEKISPLAYCLDFGESKGRVNPVVSIQYLLPYEADYDDEFDRQVAKPPPIDYADFLAADDEEHYELERILDCKLFNKTVKYLVRWKGYGPQHDEWKTKRDLKHAKDLIDDFHACEKRVSERPRRRAKGK